MAEVRSSLDIVDGKNPSIDAISAEFKNFVNYLIAYFLFQVAFVVGFVLLIIPGIYVAVTYNWFAYFISEKHYGVQESFRQSKLLSEGSRWQILKFFLATIGLNILGLLALVVGLFVTVPMTMIACVLVYRKLLLRSASSAVPAPVAPASSAPAPTV